MVFLKIILNTFSSKIIHQVVPEPVVAEEANAVFEDADPTVVKILTGGYEKYVAHHPHNIFFPRIFMI